jgi:hypothetical protein
MPSSEQAPGTDIAVRRHSEGERAVVVVYGTLDDQCVWLKTPDSRRSDSISPAAGSTRGGVSRADGGRGIRADRCRTRRASPG